MEAQFKRRFLKSVKKHAAIKKQLEAKVRQIMAHPIEMGEPLKGNLPEFLNIKSILSILSDSGSQR